MKMSRRSFLGASGAAMVAGAMTRNTVFGANDRIGVAVVGINGQGGSHIKEYLDRSSEVDLVALCDPDSRVLEGRARAAEGVSGKRPKLYKDIREMLADDDIQAFSIASPNHWHSLATIWGCQAGKDVYVEKPLSHSIWEGRQAVAAAQSTGRIVQHGTQSRSDATLMRDVQLMHSGFIGKIVHSRGYVYKTGNRNPIGKGRPSPPPEHLDWTLWQGPAEEREYMAKEDGSGLYVHYNWHWVWDYGNGEIGNQGVHEMDVACWGHDRGVPVKVYSTGGRYGWDDDAVTPNTQAVSFTYEDGSMMTFEVRNLGSFHEGGGGACSNSFFGTEGYYVRGVGFFNYKNEPIPVTSPLPETRGRLGNFLEAVRTRRQEDIFAPVGPAHVSCVHIHMANISYRLGRSLEFDPRSEQFVSDSEANALVRRVYRQGFEVPQLV